MERGINTITEKEYYYGTDRDNLEKILRHRFTYALMQDSPKNIH
jgi:hypothetical protein